MRMTEARRAERLVRAEYNLINLDAADVEIELSTDVFSTPLIGDARQDEPMREPDLAELAERVYGSANYVAVSNGRCAERALLAELARVGAVVVGHPLFFSTQRAFRLREARVEVIPVGCTGSSDLDLDALARRLAASPVDFVCVEPSTNANGGWPMTYENFSEVHVLCKRHGTRLLMDATRLLANCHRLGGAPLDLARSFTSLADAFWFSCSKELLVPSGGMIAVRDEALRYRLMDFCFMEGIHLHTTEERVRLARGLRHIAEHPEIIGERARQLTALAKSLRAVSVPIVEPIGCHAVYVDIEDLVAPADIAGLVALLYQIGGIRCSYLPIPMERRVLRLALGVGRYSDAQLASVAPGLRALFDRAAEIPTLREKHPGRSMFYGGYERVA
jgi:tryptophanase